MPNCERFLWKYGQNTRILAQRIAKNSFFGKASSFWLSEIQSPMYGFWKLPWGFSNPSKFPKFNCTLHWILDVSLRDRNCPPAMQKTHFFANWICYKVSKSSHHTLGKLWQSYRVVPGNIVPNCEQFRQKYGQNTRIFAQSRAKNNLFWHGFVFLTCRIGFWTMSHGFKFWSEAQ